MSVARLEMNAELYAYLDSVNDRETPVQRELREETLRDPRFNYAVSPMEGQYLGALVRMIGARKICEVGVYTGYSSLAMALALPPDGHLWAFDVSEAWTATARKYWIKAGVDSRITLRLAPGADSMKWLLEQGHGGTFDLVFIDADKENYGRYWDLGYELLRRGGTLVADNTMFQGVVGPSWTDDKLAAKWAPRGEAIQKELIGYTHAVRAFNRKIHADTRVALAVVPVGDGMSFGVKL
jgi:predicted O-methyltransferase YrrM